MEKKSEKELIQTEEIKAQSEEIDSSLDVVLEETEAYKKSEAVEETETVQEVMTVEETEAVEKVETAEKAEIVEKAEAVEKIEASEDNTIPEEDISEAPEQEAAPEMTEEEHRDARYLPRASVIYDENASDAVHLEEAPSEEASENEYEEMYSLNFFENEDASQDANEEADIPQEKEQEPYDPEKPRRVDMRFDFVELFVFTLALVLFITSFIIRHSVVVGGSMENTLYEGERLLISDLFYTPDYGDIIVFQDPETNVKGAVVKRIIGLPGDTIQIKRNGSIYRNGTLLIEEYVFIDEKNYTYQELYVVVPDGELFVMGDHRNNSEDSRSKGFGTIDEDSILGRVLLRFYPFDRFGSVE
ncbi:MAG: signal peptidase I [Clostridia bacterium]|nr:signal peptidase I [Clostridia bacterium]